MGCVIKDAPFIIIKSRIYFGCMDLFQRIGFASPVHIRDFSHFRRGFRCACCRPNFCNLQSGQEFENRRT